MMKSTSRRQEAMADDTNDLPLPVAPTPIKLFDNSRRIKLLRDGTPIKLLDNSRRITFRYGSTEFTVVGEKGDTPQPPQGRRRRASEPLPPLDDAPGIVTVTQAARYLGVRPKTIHRWIVEGRLESWQLKAGSIHPVFGERKEDGLLMVRTSSIIRLLKELQPQRDEHPEHPSNDNAAV
jgi:excisionase family DNA binding protein